MSISSFIKSNMLIILTLGGVGFGLYIGLLFPSGTASDSLKLWIGLPGELFLNTLRMLAVPLIATSVICEIACMDAENQGKIGVAIVLWIVFTNSLGSIIGICAGLAISPAIIPERSVQNHTHTGPILQTEDVFADLFRNLLPNNIVGMFFEQVQTTYDGKTKSQTTTPHPNFLGLISVSLAFGIAASLIGEEAKPFISAVRAASKICLKLIDAFMWTTPIGAFSLTAGALLSVDNPTAAFATLGMFLGAAYAAILIYMLVIMPVVMMFISRRNPLSLLRDVSTGALAAFGASNTLAAMPQIYDVPEKYWSVDTQLTKVCVPLVVTLGAPASAVFISSACITLAKLAGSALLSAQVVTVWILTTVLSCALPCVPSSSLVVIAMLLDTFDIHANNFVLLYAAEWLSDRFRSMCNGSMGPYCSLAVSSIFPQQPIRRSTSKYSLLNTQEVQE